MWTDQWYQFNCSSNAHERLGGVLAIDELIDVKVNATTAVTPGLRWLRSLGSPGAHWQTHPCRQV